MRVLPLLTALCVSVAQAEVPAALNGIWTVEQTAPVNGTPAPRVEVFISGSSLRGSFGCGKFAGTLSAGDNRVRMAVASLPPAPNERCLYAANLPLVRELNVATRYVVTRDHLVLFSGTSRLVLTRIGFVTPVSPR
ncbi:hypothetical protein [Deinococcus apachensis]|uniref:hypothetical protein n=1 Tax=Deinococcus apachensis TaxID=309886 RepID=UPI000363BEBD|nr:hypothetical protein [Deinococcus apachensis]